MHNVIVNKICIDESASRQVKKYGMVDGIQMTWGFVISKRARVTSNKTLDLELTGRIVPAD